MDFPGGPAVKTLLSNAGGAGSIPSQGLGSYMLLLLLSHFSCVQLYAAPWTAAHQAPPSMGFSRQEY